MKKLSALFIIVMLIVGCFCEAAALAEGTAEQGTVIFSTACIEKTVTSLLRTGDDLCLPRISATQGENDVTSLVKVNVYDAHNDIVNGDGSFIAENLAAGIYTVEYYVGESKSERYSVTVSDSAPSASLDDDKRPDQTAYRDVAYRVRAIGVDEESSVIVYLYDGIGNEVYSEEQKAGSRQVSLNPSVCGWNNVTYKVINGDSVVLCSFPVYVDIKDYEGDYFGYSFEGDDWIDAYNIGVWCNTTDNAEALEAVVTKEESRSGSSSLKLVSVNLAYQPTFYFRLDFGNNMQMRKDDETVYTIRFYMKKGEDFSYEGLLPVVDFHALAKKNTNDAHYGAYKWNLGNFLIKSESNDGWTLVEYDFVSYSDDYVFSRDWLESSPNYSTYGGIQFVMVPTNYTGTIYIDDVQLFKKGVTVDDLLVSYPHDGEENNGGSDGPENGSAKNGCGAGSCAKTVGALIALVAVAAFPNRKRY